ncbi:hypothetical protein CMI47_20315 [Candidatus Pacearchaeota archaeon]|nr:hypothetical protein [Candidatus Pacearchaeota archaeon]|tara:strand:- start:2317 stop:2742 length:426 start_codon:yes stop_codon:yes gene_type:complete
MNPFLKQAYDLGAQQALQDYGITKEAGLPAALQARVVQALGAAKGLPGKARDYLQTHRAELLPSLVGLGALGGLAGLGYSGSAQTHARKRLLERQGREAEGIGLTIENLERDIHNIRGGSYYDQEPEIPQGDIPHELLSSW